jgi:serine phosphatase RsbU (regulator of sigma subunit)
MHFWRLSVAAESLLPTIALFLQTQTATIGPARTLTSPAILTYFLFIILSTLHLDLGLSRLAGACSAVGYAATFAYVLVRFPEAVEGSRFLLYMTSFSCVALLLLGGYAAGSVADQIRRYVLAAIHDAENRARIAKLEKNLEIAKTIQEGLLPRAEPAVDGFDIAGWNKPADETGGDYFDWQEVADGRIAFTIADVSGHGIGPALCTASCRAYARSLFDSGTDVRSLLGRLNRHMCADLPPGKFVTLATGVLDPAESSLELISAGHGPLLFYISAENRFRSYDAQGVPLGLLPSIGYGPAQQVRFASGDILALVTDGFVEWTSVEGEEFGEKRLQHVVKENRHKPASSIIAELHQAVKRFAGAAPQQDDFTVVIIKRR